MNEVHQWVDTFMAQYEGGNKATWACYRSDLRKWVEWCARPTMHNEPKVDPLRADARAVSNWMLFMRCSQLAEKTVHRRVNTLHRFHQMLVRCGVRPPDTNNERLATAGLGGRR